MRNPPMMHLICGKDTIFKNSRKILDMCKMVQWSVSIFDWDGHVGSPSVHFQRCFLLRQIMLNLTFFVPPTSTRGHSNCLPEWCPRTIIFGLMSSLFILIPFSPTALVICQPPPQSVTESRRWDSNPRSADYESAALPS